MPYYLLPTAYYLLLATYSLLLTTYYLPFKAALSIAQCRWNFLRSQTLDQVDADVLCTCTLHFILYTFYFTLYTYVILYTLDQMDADEETADTGDFATLEFDEMLECMARCRPSEVGRCHRYSQRSPHVLSYLEDKV